MNGRPDPLDVLAKLGVDVLCDHAAHVDRCSRRHRRAFVAVTAHGTLVAGRLSMPLRQSAAALDHAAGGRRAALEGWRAWWVDDIDPLWWRAFVGCPCSRPVRLRDCIPQNALG